MADAEPLATVDELQARLPFDMDEMEQREAMGALEYLSDEARVYGLDSWATAAGAPQAVKSLVLKAAIRHMKQYEGYVQSRAGDETLQWSDHRENAGSAYFTDAEIATLGRLAGGGGITSVGVYAWQSPADGESGDIWVPTEYGDTFPLFSPEDKWATG